MLLYYAICIPERCSSASLLLPAAPLCCSSATAVLHKCNWCGYVITRVRLHSWTLPVLLLKLLLWLGLAWVEEFKLSLSLCLELAWLGYLGLGTLKKENSANCPNSPLVHVFPPLLRKEWTKVQVF